MENQAGKNMKNELETILELYCRYSRVIFPRQSVHRQDTAGSVMWPLSIGKNILGGTLKATQTVCG